MKIAILSDVHGNVPALEAALAAILPEKPDALYSLGDQVNLGPDATGVFERLRAAGCVCLSGNHERYVRAVHAGAAGYAGAEFASIRWCAAQLRPQDVALPERVDLPGVTLCHAMPGDDRFPVFLPDTALPMLASGGREGARQIVCGHGHNPTHFSLPQRRVFCVGSTGCPDEGVPGMAGWTMLTLTGDGLALRHAWAAYDPMRLPRRFLESGLAEATPVMARVFLTQFLTGRAFLIPFVKRARGLQAELGKAVMSERTLLAAEAAFPWPDGLSLGDFWRQYA